MTHGVHRRSAKGRRTRRKIRRGQFKSMDAYQSRYDRLIPRTHWNRKHPHFRRFSFAGRIRGFGKGKRQ